MDIANVSLGLAFLAGLVSFLSPCVFALVPAYVGYLSGRSMAYASGGTYEGDRWVTFSHGLAFVIGFSVVLHFLEHFRRGRKISTFDFALHRIKCLRVFGFALIGII